MLSKVLEIQANKEIRFLRRNDEMAWMSIFKADFSIFVTVASNLNSRFLSKLAVKKSCISLFLASEFSLTLTFR